MPYILTDTAHHDGVAFKRGDIVSDELGAAMNDFGHHAKLTRFAHDDDLCEAGGLSCDHLNAAPGPEVVAAKTASPDRESEE
jgi:hypothetical protein